MRFIVCQAIGMLDDGQGFSIYFGLFFSLIKRKIGFWREFGQKCCKYPKNFQGSQIRWAFLERKKEADGQSNVIFSPFSRTEGKQEK
jgi:hypothetical protein